MLPGDYIAMKLTGEASATASMLSEGVFWDFKNKSVSQDILDCYGFDAAILPEIKPLFGRHGSVTDGLQKHCIFLRYPCYL